VSGATGCKSASGLSWGYRSDGQSSAGPIAEAPDAAGDATAPDTEMQASLTAAAPAGGTVGSTTGLPYWKSYTFDAVGNRASSTEHNPSSPSLDATFKYTYGKTVTGSSSPTLVQPHILTGIDRPAGTDPTYVSDATGNTTERHVAGGDQILDWNAENKVTSVTGFAEGSGPVVGLSGSAWTWRAAPPPTAPRSSCTAATTPRPRRGPSPATPCASGASAPLSTARSSNSARATAPPTRSSPSARPTRPSSTRGPASA
jgi:hypothetical protein